MTKDEAADTLIEAYQGSPAEMRARRANRRRKALLDGDATMIRSMLLTASSNDEQTPGALQDAVRVLSAR